jgi:hypothetical protein
MFLGNAKIFIPTQTRFCIVVFLTEYWTELERRKACSYSSEWMWQELLREMLLFDSRIEVIVCTEKKLVLFLFFVFINFCTFGTREYNTMWSAAYIVM